MTRTEDEKWRVTPGIYALVYLHKVVNLRNTSKAAFWSEPCTPNLQRNTAFKQVGNREEGENPSLWVTFKASASSLCLRMKSRQKHQAGAYLRGLWWCFDLCFHLAAKDSRRATSKWSERNMFPSVLWRQVNFWEEKGGQLVAKGGAGKGKEFCVLTAVSVGSVHKRL